MVGNPRGGNMTPKGNFAPANNSCHEMSRGTPANPSAGVRSCEAGGGPAGLSIILDLRSVTETYIIIPRRTGVICRNAVSGIEAFLLPTGFVFDPDMEDPARGVRLVGVTLDNLTQYQGIAEQWISEPNLGSSLAEVLRPLSVEKIVDYLKTGLPVAEKWIPFQVSDDAPVPFYAPFIGQLAILVY